jgi:flavodoxin
MLKVLKTILLTLLTLGQVYSLYAESKPKKVLVVYYSRTGTTKLVAEELAQKLNADIEVIVDKKNRNGVMGYLKAARAAKNEYISELEDSKTDPKKYDLVIVGTPIWAWNVSTPVRTYLVKYKDMLPAKLAFFTTASGTKPDKIIAKMESITGKKAVASTGFTGQDFSKKNKDAYTKKIDSFVESVK